MKIKRLLSLALAFLLVLSCVPVTARAAETVNRLAGENRYETALKVADKLKVELGVEKFSSIIIASGNDFADALAGSYLSTVKNAPILLSWGNGGKYITLDENNIAYIKANLAPGGTVYILGGDKAVPELYEEALSDYTVNRLGGANRFETNLLILTEAGVADGAEVLVCTATNFADSLSASATGKPILLVFNEQGNLYGKQPEYLASLKGCSFTIIGGESAVSTNLEKAISGYGKVDRLAGVNRFETSVLVAQTYFEAPETVILAYAWNYPDGLCGGSLAHAMGAPLILTQTRYEDEAAQYVDSGDIATGTVLGGTSLISEKAVDLIFMRNPVSDAYHSHAPSYEVNGGVPYYIPRVDLPGDKAAEVNKTIYNDLKGYLNSSMQTSYDRGMNYLWARKDNIISILVLAGEDYNTAESAFYVYNVSTTTGERLPNSALWEAYGLSGTEYYDRLHEILDEYYSGMMPGSMSDDYKAYLETQIARSHSTENLEAAMPYVDVNGDLCVAIKIYSFAGPDYHYCLYNLTGTATPKRPTHHLHDESLCTGDVSAQSPYKHFLENGCYCRDLKSGDVVRGYVILDINGDGVKELLVRTQHGTSTGLIIEEFDCTLVYTVNEQGEIVYVGKINSYTFIYYSEEHRAIRYLESRGAGIYTYVTLKDSAIVEISKPSGSGTYHWPDWIDIT